ncbi:serine hydrolase [Erythrobacter sp.]|uniref:serine hydrolase domain-containing protein n=1 Tax=Erythrobacter sp. TaxID=1042 RepID=UPI0025DE1162|nr:serine hydrolase domain-containing protein [Erythrobacter sp.]
MRRPITTIFEAVALAHAASYLFLAITMLVAMPASAHSLEVELSATDYQFGDKASLDRCTEEARRDEGVIGSAIAAARADRVLYARAFGYADRERGIEATIDTRFAVASVTKILTATAIMMLVDEGKIDLDTPVNNYLGDDRVRATFGGANLITVSRVMDHTAGLPLLYQPLYADEKSAKPEFSELIRDYGYTILPPGVSSQYSSFGYEILAELIRRQSGMSYADFVRTRIFEPLNMNDSLIATGRRLPDGAAQRYMVDGTIAPGVDTSHPGAANAYLTVADMIRFGRFWLAAYNGETPLLSQASARAMITNDKGELGKGPGKGLWPEDYPGNTLYVSHGGSMAGAKARLAILPDRDLVVASAINERNSTAEAYLLEEMIRSFENESNLYWRAPVVPAAIAKSWRGTIGGNRKVADLELDFSDSNAPVARIDGKPVLVRGIGGEENFSIRLDGELSGAGMGVPHDLRLFLVPHGDQLIGEVRLESFPQTDRDHPSVGYWVRLQPA